MTILSFKEYLDQVDESCSTKRAVTGTYAQLYPPASAGVVSAGLPTANALNRDQVLKDRRIKTT